MNPFWGGAHFNEINGALSDEFGNLYITGRTNTSNFTTLKLDTNGTNVWSHITIGTEASTAGKGMIWGIDNSLIVSGEIDSVGNEATLVIAYDKDGNQAL